MLYGFWGRKIGMTQVFEGDAVIPVTVIDTGSWRVVGYKTAARDGHNALCIGLLRDRYAQKEFDAQWMKRPSTYFSHIQEIVCEEADLQQEVGSVFSAAAVADKGTLFDAFGDTIGRGFQGGVKRHGFSGGRGSHGDKLGRKPGSLSFMRSQGRVIKGKRMPGHMGVERVVMRNLPVVSTEPDKNIVIVKGSLPGKAGAVVFMRKCA